MEKKLFGASYTNAFAPNARIITVVGQPSHYRIQARYIKEKGGQKIEQLCDFVICKAKLGNNLPPREGDSVGLYYHSDKRFQSIIAGVELRGTMLFMLTVDELEKVAEKLKWRSAPVEK